MRERKTVLMLDPKPNNSSIVCTWAFTSIWPENGSHVCAVRRDLTQLLAHCSDVTESLEQNVGFEEKYSAEVHKELISF